MSLGRGFPGCFRDIALLEELPMDEKRARKLLDILNKSGKWVGDGSIACFLIAFRRSVHGHVQVERRRQRTRGMASLALSLAQRARSEEHREWRKSRRKRAIEQYAMIIEHPSESCAGHSCCRLAGHGRV